MMTPATRRALQLPELLEMVIVKLPARQIFVLQRVSHQWRQVIKESKTVQQVLYLRPLAQPVKPKELIVMDNPMALAVKYNEELEYNSNLRVAVPDCSDFDLNDVAGDYDLLCATLKPIQTTLRTSLPCCLLEGADRDSRSYSEMFITQPPCTTAMLEVLCDVGDNNCITLRCSVRDTAGLTFGFLFQVSAKMVRDVNTSFRVEGASVEVIICMPVSEEARDRWQAQAQWLESFVRRTEASAEVLDAD